MTSKIFGIADDVSAFLLKLERLVKNQTGYEWITRVIKVPLFKPNSNMNSIHLLLYLFTIIESKCDSVYSLYSPILISWHNSVIVIGLAVSQRF